MVKKFLYLILTGLLIMLTPVESLATDYYITQSGSGSYGGLTYANSDSIATFNAGSSPYNDLDGDTVYLCGTITTQVTIPDGGSSGYPVTIHGTNPTTPGGIIDGNSTLDQCLDLNGKSYITIEDLIVQEAATNGGIWGYYASGNSSNIIIDGVTAKDNTGRGILIANENDATSNVTITNCTVYNNTYSGINLTKGVNTATISNNTVYSNGSEGGYHAGIKLGTDATGVYGITIEHNNCYSNTRCGIHVDTVGTSIVIRYNKTNGNSTTGILLEKTNNAAIYYNLSYSNTTEGINVYDTCSGNEVYGNTIYGNTASGLACNGNSGTTNNNVFKNNISDGNSPELYVVGGCDNVTYGSGNVFNYNCFGAEVNNFITWTSSKNSYTAWETAYGGTTYSITSAPSFADAANGDFRLISSVGLNAGITLSSTYDDALDPRDIDGFPYSTADQDDYGGGWEIGAFVHRGTLGGVVRYSDGTAITGTGNEAYIKCYATTGTGNDIRADNNPPVAVDTSDTSTGSWVVTGVTDDALYFCSYVFSTTPKIAGAKYMVAQ